MSPVKATRTFFGDLSAAHKATLAALFFLGITAAISSRAAVVVENAARVPAVEAEVRRAHAKIDTLNRNVAAWQSEQTRLLRFVVCVNRGIAENECSYRYLSGMEAP